MLAILEFPESKTTEKKSFFTRPFSVLFGHSVNAGSNNDVMLRMAASHGPFMPAFIPTLPAASMDQPNPQQEVASTSNH